MDVTRSVQHRPYPREFPNTFFHAEAAPNTMLGDRLISRVVSAYRDAQAEAQYGGFWISLFEKNEMAHKALIDGAPDEVRRFWGRPADSWVMHGFDEQSLDHKPWRDSESGAHLISIRVMDAMIRLGEATMARRVEYPETTHRAVWPSAETILSELDLAFDIRVDFPNPFPGERGVVTDRGLVSFRAPQAVYQAWRVRRLAGPDARMVEIGAGLARSSYYAYRFGLKEQTLVDLPFTAVSQGFYLSLTLGEGTVGLCNERPKSINIRTPGNSLRRTTNMT